MDIAHNIFTELQDVMQNPMIQTSEKGTFSGVLKNINRQILLMIMKHLFPSANKLGMVSICEKKSSTFTPLLPRR